MRHAIQRFGLPLDSRHPGKEPLGLFLHALFAQFAVELSIQVGQMGGIQSGIVELLLAERSEVPAGALHILHYNNPEVALQQRRQREAMTTQERCGAVGVKDIQKGERKVPLQDPDVVVSGVKDLEDRRIAEDLSQKCEVEAGQRIDDPCFFTGLGLDKTKLVPKVAEGIVLRIQGDDPGRSD